MYSINHPNCVIISHSLIKQLCIAIIAATLQIPVLALHTQALDFPNSMQLGALPSKGEFIVVKATDAELKRLHVMSLYFCIEPNQIYKLWPG